MHKPTKAKWRAFKCRNGVHRWVDEIWIKAFDGYVAGCKDCGKIDDKKALFVNGKRIIRDVNLHVTSVD